MHSSPPAPAPAPGTPLHVHLRPVTPADLPVLFEMQSDPESARMSACRPRTREQFYGVWERTWAAEAAGRSVPRAIVVMAGDGANKAGHSTDAGDRLVGSIGVFTMPTEEGDLDAVGYAIVRDWWGRGIATRALQLLLEEVKLRPLHARAAATNLGSVKVLTRCGFVCTGTRFSPESSDGRYLACEESSFIFR